MSNYALNIKGKEVLLNKELVKISNGFMKAYKDDILLDIELLLDKNKLSNNFIWVIRECGSHLYEKNKLFILEDGSRDDYLYFKDYRAKVFEINVTKRGYKNVYGTLTKLSRKEVTNNVINNGRHFKNVQVKVILNDGAEHNVAMESEDLNIYKIAEMLKINVEDIKKVYRQYYFN